jgi:hypothetical protein
MPDGSSDLKYRLVEEGRLDVNLADQLDALSPEGVLAQVNATLRRRQAAQERKQQR